MQRRARGLAWVVAVGLGMTAPAVLAQSTFSCRVASTVALPSALTFPAHGVILADVAGDKNLDVIAVDEDNGEIDIFPGTGRGTFLNATKIAGFSSPVALAAASLRNDSRNDLIVADADSTTVCILFHGGDVGTFEAPICYGLDDDPVAITIFDMDRDGLPDIAVLGDSSVSLLKNLDGNFDFFNPPSVDTLDTGGSGIVSGLFSKDGRTDMVTTNSDGNSISILLANGDGTFATAVVKQIGTTPVGIVSGDYDENGDLDVAVVNNGDQQENIAICLGDGAGGFDCSGARPDGETDPNGLASGFLDGKATDPDAHLDLVVTDNTDGTMTLLQGTGTGEFIKPETPRCFLRGFVQEGLTTGDLDNDGLLDVAVIVDSADPPQLQILINTTGQVPTPTVTRTGSPPAGGTPTATLSGPTGSPTPTLTRTATRTATPTFTPTVTPTPIPTAAFGLCDLSLPGKPAGVTTGDFDGDGEFDVAVSDAAGGVVRVLLNSPELISIPNCMAHATTSTPVPAGLQPGAIVAADLDADGNLDLAVVGRVTDGADSVAVLYGDGHGGFAAPVIVALGSQTVTDPRAIIAVDVDGDNGRPDGVPDLVIANESSSDLSIVRGRRNNRVLGPARSIPVGRAASSLTTGDFNHDGLFDLAVGSDRAGDISLLVQDPTAANGFRPAGSFGRAGPVAAVVTERFDADGLLDLAVTRNPCTDAVRSAGTVDIFSGGTLSGNEPVFDPTGQYTVRRCPQAAIAADFNRDARADVVVANTDTGDLSFLFGNGTGTFLVSLPFTVGVNPISLAFADIDGDGGLDVVVANQGSGASDASVSILLSSRPPPTPTPTHTWTPTISPTASPSPTATLTSTVAPTSTPTQIPSQTPSNTPTETATYTPTSTPTRTASPTITQTPPASLTPTPTKIGILVLSPGGCDVQDGRRRLGWGPAIGIAVLAVLSRRRRRTGGA